MNIPDNIPIIGSGIAGLTAAYFISEKYPVTIISAPTSKSQTSSSQLAQGGIAGAKNWQQHYEDTLKAGKYKNNPKNTKIFCQEAWEAINFLKNKIGVKFNKEPILEGGHLEKRIWTTGDDTGKTIYQALKNSCQKKNITWQQGRAVSALKDENNNIAGVSYLVNNKYYQHYSPVIILATGGIGGLFEFSTNPLNLTGDGLKIAHEAGAKVSNLDIIQFHPTGLKSQDKPVFLISEALRGYGACLVNEKEERFLKNFPLKELETRDIIVNEMLKQKKVFLDLRKKPASFWQNKFPNICKKLQLKKINVEKDLIPVTPTEHFLCGGIKVDSKGETNINNLFALGECSNTGIHGLNRLASNSLSEAVVFASRCAQSVLKRKFTQIGKNIFNCSTEITPIKKTSLAKLRSYVQKNITPGNINKKELMKDLDQIEDGMEKETVRLFC